MPSVIFTLTFLNLAANAVTDLKPYEIGVAKDVEAFVTSAQLAKLTELPIAGSQNIAFNVTVVFRPDSPSEVSKCHFRSHVGFHSVLEFADFSNNSVQISDRSKYSLQAHFLCNSLDHSCICRLLLITYESVLFGR